LRVEHGEQERERGQVPNHVDSQENVQHAETAYRPLGKKDAIGFASAKENG